MLRMIPQTQIVCKCKEFFILQKSSRLKSPIAKTDNQVSLKASVKALWNYEVDELYLTLSVGTLETLLVLED